MAAFVPERLHDDLREEVVVRSAALPWVPSPEAGVERRFLEREGGEVARATSIVRYAAGSAFSPHVHGRGEEFLVLEGTFSDEGGDFGVGTYVRNPPGTRHAPFSRDGCTIFVKLRQMDAADRRAVVVRTHGATAAPTAIEGVRRIALYRSDREEVAIEIFDPGTTLRARESAAGGEEILVISGKLRYGEEECEPATWLRFPAGRERPIGTETGCRLWVKRGHLN